jgi:hypothetical protein
MKTIYLTLFFFNSLSPLLATQVAPKTLSELVGDADFIVEAKIIGVEMRDGDGIKIVNKNAATGPGISNQLFLKVQLVKNGFTHPEIHEIPNEFWIPLWQRWYDTLANRTKESLGKTYIFLLKEETFEPVYPSGFNRAQSELIEIKALLNKAEQ